MIAGIGNDPRSRIFQNPEALEDWELVAILLGKGTREKNVESLAREILAKHKGLLGLLNTAPSILLSQPGIGKAKIASLFAAREMVNRMKLQYMHLESNSPDTTKKKLMELLFLKSQKEIRECFYLITLDHEENLHRIELIAKGSLTEVGVHLRDLVKIILDDAAANCLIAHNHPKQSCDPSFEDFELYNNLSRFLEKLDICLLDQWVIGNDGIYSCEQRKRIIR
ncbi:MAG: JAB domain-containing protein [Spirochaetota bacterium]